MAEETNLGLEYLYRYGRPGCLICGTQTFCSNSGFPMTVDADKIPTR